MIEIFEIFDNLPKPRIFNPGYHIIGSMEVNDPLPKVSPGSVGKVSTKNISNRTIKESRLGMSKSPISNFHHEFDKLYNSISNIEG